MRLKIKIDIVFKIVIKGASKVLVMLKEHAFKQVLTLFLPGGFRFRLIILGPPPPLPPDRIWVKMLRMKSLDCMPFDT